MKTRAFIFLVIWLAGCSSIKLSQHFHENDVYVIQSLEAADIYYPQAKVITAATKKYNLTDTLEQSVLARFTNNKENIYIRPISKYSSREDTELAVFMDPITHELLLSGDAVIFDKRSKRFTKRIGCKFNRCNGVVSSISFRFRDGTEFYHKPVAIVEMDD